jgi:hypothetical protein
MHKGKQAFRRILYFDIDIKRDMLVFGLEEKSHFRSDQQQADGVLTNINKAIVSANVGILLSQP